MWRKKQPQYSLEEWLRALPRQQCKFYQNHQGLVTLQVPRARNPLLRKIIGLFNPNPYIKIKLDEKGSFIWLRCDGQTSIAQICQELEQEYGDSIKPSRERTVKFIKQLYRYRLISLYMGSSTDESFA